MLGKLHHLGPAPLFLAYLVLILMAYLLFVNANEPSIMAGRRELLERDNADLRKETVRLRALAEGLKQGGNEQ
ncbi:hypothetical protein [Thiomonas sp.]